MSVRLGYACISIPLREKDIYTSRTVTLGTLNKLSSTEQIEKLKELAIQNIKDLQATIEYNESQGIRFFRITSNLFPHMENPKLSKNYTIDFARPLLQNIGELARKYGHRLTMHPGQFAQLGSPREEVVEQTIRDLTQHADILAAIGLSGSVMIIHGGGTFGDKHATMQRFAANFKRLPKYVQDYISLENDEFSYSVMDLLPLCEALKIPLCIDFFHHTVKHIAEFDIFEPALIARCMLLWTSRGIKPKCHYSEQKPCVINELGETIECPRRGAHSDCITEIPAAILQIAKEYQMDIMLEVKNKDVCCLEMYKKYFARTVNTQFTPPRVEWYLAQ